MGWIVRVFFFTVAFVAALAFGVVWYAFAAQGGNSSRVSTNANAAAPPAETASHAPSNNGGKGEGETPTVAWSEEKETPTGYAAVPRLTLRRDTGPTAATVAEIDTSEYDRPEIRRATRDHLLVSYGVADDEGRVKGEHVGWVEWGQVTPHASAVVLDAEDGSVVARMPVSPGVSHAAFSPDGKRVLFYSTVYDGGHDEASTVAFELKADGYEFVRSLKASGGGWASLVYGEAEGELRALVMTVNYGERETVMKLHPFEIGGEKAGPAAGVRAPQPGELIVSADGRTGLSVSHAASGEAHIDVIDMLTLRVRNSFVLAGSTGDAWPHERVLSHDGTELYYRSGAERESVAVVDTRDGRLLRDIPVKTPAGQWMSFSQQSAAGGALLVRFWKEGSEIGLEAGEGGEGAEQSEGTEAHASHEEATTSQSFWVGADGKTTPAERGVEQLLRVGSELYAIDDAGTQLFKLDADGRVVKRFQIERPELRHDPHAAETYAVMGLSASPDGKHIIIFYGIPDRC